ncbi:MAG: VWA domain-containing protein [Candidatus Acidiferrales bacterium]
MRAHNPIILEAMKALKQSRTARPAAALAGLLLLAGGLNHAASQQPPPPTASETLRVDVRVVNVYCTVKTKKGALITDLETSDFEIREDGKKQELRYFVRETDRPLTLALLLDTSISQKAVLPIEIETAAQFFRQVLRPVDLALLMSFDVNVDLLHDFTSDVEQLQESLQLARINSPVDLGPFPRTRTAGTRLYDAIYLASREKLGPEVGRKAIILVTDGFDSGSSKKEKEALEAAHRGEIILYAIGVADPHFYQSRGGTLIGASVLKKLARETGGLAVFPRNPEQLRRAFEQIATELRSQYILGYTPTNRAYDGRFRKIEVKVKRKGLKVQARRGYYAPTR